MFDFGMSGFSTMRTTMSLSFSSATPKLRGIIYFPDAYLRLGAIEYVLYIIIAYSVAQHYHYFIPARRHL